MIRVAGIFLLLAITLSSSNAISGGKDQIYRYADLVSGSELQLDINKMEVTIDSHSVFDVQGCKSSQKYMCIISTGFYIVFPIGKIYDGMSWEYGGRQFKVVKKTNRKLLGKMYMAFLIQYQEGSDKYWYLFSQEAGLLALGMLNHRAISTFILQEECGFASSSTCKNH